MTEFVDALAMIPGWFIGVLVGLGVVRMVLRVVKA